MVDDSKEVRIITTLLDLQAAIAALPPVQPGKVRVFRGQTKCYGQIKSAAVRGAVGDQSLLRNYVDLLVDDEERADGPRALGDEAQSRYLWFDAVAQHYSTGSHYLDVSYCAESAAWFALHQSEEVHERDIEDVARPQELAALTGASAWIGYSRASNPGVLYAFDLDPWNLADRFPPTLSLVDLAQAPAVFRSPRMAVQRGCLVRPRREDHDDLMAHCVPTTPLSVAWPMTGSAVVERGVEEMFPSPALDPWYRRFLNAPMVPEVRPVSGGPLVRRCLPIALYRGESRAYNQAIKEAARFPMPPLLYVALQRRSLQAEAVVQEKLGMAGIEAATPIVLEAPLMRIVFKNIGGRDAWWNDELLVSDLPDDVAAYEVTREPKDDKLVVSGHVGLRNVFWQFSPLEYTSWVDDGAQSNSPGRIRGLWLVRGAEEWIATFISQESDQSPPTLLPPMIITAKPEARRLVCRFPDPTGASQPLDAFGPLGLAVRVALHLLRTLNPAFKVQAYPGSAVSIDGSAAVEPVRYQVMVYADAARLLRASGPAGVQDWFVIRNPANVSFTTAVAQEPALFIKTTEAYGALSAADCQALLQQYLGTQRVG